MESFLSDKAEFVSPCLGSLGAKLGDGGCAGRMRLGRRGRDAVSHFALRLAFCKTRDVAA